jgi:putative transposase
MNTIRRIFTPGFPYHVICRGSQRTSLFPEASDFDKYLSILLEAKRKFEMKIHHYALMPNHVHLLVSPTLNNGSAFMRHLNMTYAKYSCKKREIIGHVWKNHFKNPVIQSDAYLLACGNYIEMNPVRWGLVVEPGSWKYSSFLHYAKGETNALIDDSPLYQEFGKTSEERCANYVRWIGTTRS